MTPDQIKYSIQTRRLQFGFRDKASHYSVVAFFGLVSIAVLYLFIQNLLVDQTFSFERGFEFAVFIGFSIFTHSIYKAQKNRLELEIFPLDLSSNDFRTTLEKLAKIKKWELNSDERLMLLSTNKEKTIFLFDKERILITSLFDPDSLGFLFRIFRKPRLLGIIKNELRR